MLDTAPLRALCDAMIGGKPGVRIYQSPIINALLSDTGKVGRKAATLLGPTFRPVRAVMFDKSPEANWSLGWHQDRTIAVRERIETEGYGPWSTKAGSIHVEPPFAITRDMITVRLHLDDVDNDNAPLLIAPGSHEIGRIPASEINAVAARLGTFTCLAQSGDAWLYATSILHASNAATHVRHRRVLQVDFSAMELPNGLQWLGVTD